MKTKFRSSKVLDMFIFPPIVFMQMTLWYFTRYAACSGQIINTSISSIFWGGISNDILNSIVNLFGFNIGDFPFQYLGALVFKGRPKVVHFQPIADKIKTELASRKTSLLSMAGRVQMVKSVIDNMFLHAMEVYSWPISFLKEIERWIKNFIWSGDTEEKNEVDYSLLEEGLLRSRWRRFRYQIFNLS